MIQLQDMANQAVQLHQSGQFLSAIKLYEEVLLHHPNHPDLLFLLGSAYHQIGKNQQALVQLNRSISINTNNAAAFINHGNVLNQLQRWNEALASYDKALKINPNLPEGYFNRGLVLQTLRRLDEALLAYDETIRLNPNYVEAFNNRGNVLNELGQPEKALASYDAAIRIKPDHIQAYLNRGHVLNDLKHFDEALQCFDEALAIAPNLPEPYYNRGNTLNLLGRYEEALVAYDKALAINPDYQDIHINRGNVYKTLKQWDEALACYDKVLEINPLHAESHYNRGNVLTDLKRWDEALASYQQALKIKPLYAEAFNNIAIVMNELARWDEALTHCDQAVLLKEDYAEAYFNRANLLTELMRLDEALVSYDKALYFNTDYVDAYWNKSLLLILTGRYTDGWQLYEWRMRQDDLKHSYPFFSEPEWRGQSSIGGKRLLIQGEQGFGDVIQFCRYLPKLQSLGAELIFEVHPALVNLLSSLQCSMTLVAKGKVLPQFDAYCPVMSLPFVFGTTVETIPADIPYLFSDASKVKQWQNKLGNRNLKRIGLAWSGSSTHKKDKNRSLRLEDFLPFTHLPFEWHSLQKEYRQQDKDILDLHPEIHQHQSDLVDFSDTAALLECMDLVICVDTSIAHVAGALGKPVWILLPYIPDYRWLLDRHDSPWYPSACLYRQDQSRNWQSVIQNIVTNLSVFLT